VYPFTGAGPCYLSRLTLPIGWRMV